MRLTKPLIVILLMASLLLSCQKELYNFSHKYTKPKVSSEPSLVQFVVDGTDANNINQANHLKKTLEYTKIPYQSIGVDAFNTNKNIAKSTRVLCVYNSELLENATLDSIQSFVAKGGTLFLLKATKDKRLSFLLGLNPVANFNTNNRASGYYFKQPFFPDLKGFSLKLKSIHNGLAKENFTNKVNVLVTATNTQYPVILEHQIGKGKVLLYNSNVEFDKWSRGILFSTTLNGLEGVPYPIANTSTIFLDDFPSPLYDIYKTPIKEELNLSIADYVKDVWWPDMKKLAEKQNLTYTAYAVFDYNEQVQPPFIFKEWDRNVFVNDNKILEKSVWIGQDIIASGHEMALHGYNHVSLLTTDWKQPDYMATALATAAKKWKTVGFGALPISYVPPSNYIDSIGLAQLKKAMPSIKYVQSTYLGDIEDGGDRDFDPDPYHNGFFGYPRITSGFDLDSDNLFALESMNIYTGIWTHFVHPDDVFQIPDASNKVTSSHYPFRNQNELNWYTSNGKKGMLDKFTSTIIQFKKRHPFSRFLNATESSKIVQDWRYAYYTHLQQADRYVVDTDYYFGGNTNYWLVYSAANNTKILEEDLNKNKHKFKKTALLNGYLFTVSTDETTLSLPNLKYKNEFASIPNAIMVQEVNNKKNEYLNRQTILQPLNKQINAYVEQGDLNSATNLFQTNILKGVNITRSQWLDYATYMVWQKKENNLWQVVEQFYQNSNHKNKVVKLSRSISKIADYSTLKIRETWLTRHIEDNTEDISILKEYVDYFSVDLNKTKIKDVLKKIAIVEPNENNKKKYIEHLLAFKFDDLFTELNKIDACEEGYMSSATAIAWIYADNFMFDKALDWSKCSLDIDEETKQNWWAYSSNFDSLKTLNFPLYIKILLQKNTKKALKELQNKEACTDSSLVPLAKDIAYAYEGFKLYREALSWGKCAKDLPVTSVLSWYHQLKEYELLSNTYSNYIALNPEDHNAKLHMSLLLLYSGKVNASVAIAKTIPKGIGKTRLKAKINAELKNLNIRDQRKVIASDDGILYKNVSTDISNAIRLQEGNSVSGNTEAIYDATSPISLANVLSYNLYDKKFNVHSLSVTQSVMSPIRTGRPRNNNNSYSLFGFMYGYKNTSKEELQYWANGGLEKDVESQDLFYKIGAGLISNKERNFTSFEANFFPVKSGAGYSANIYRLMLDNYNEFLLSKTFRQVFALQGNYYTDSQVEVILTSRSEFRVLNGINHKLFPYAEVSYGQGSVERRGGFPYWMAENRAYAGPGVLLQLGTEKSKFNGTLDAGIFAETNEPTFQRYIGNLSYRLFNFTKLQLGVEVYTIDNYFSNTYQLGFVHNFK